MIPRFRAWDTHEQKMFASDELIIWNNNVYANDSKKLSCNNLMGWSIDEEYLMQSTGLLDKNGKEIFEGDILKINDTYAEVDYDCSCFLVSFIEKIQENQVDNTYLVILTVKELLEDYKVTVIGNVYANPELKELAKG